MIIKPKTIVVYISLIILSSCSFYTLPYEDEKDEVFLYRMIEIGGVKQAIMIRGYDPENPVMLYLHGGPGFPLFPYLDNMDAMIELEKNYTMVYWEQRGTGKSFHRDITEKSMNIDRFVKDTQQVIEYIKLITGEDKVFLWAHSWGTNFGALFAAMYPELLHAYISTGQSVNPFKNEQLAYEFVYKRAKEENNRNVLRELETISANPDKYSIEDALLVRKWVYRYGGIVKQMDQVRSYVNLDDAAIVLFAEEYSFPDKLRLIFNQYYSINKLWDDLMKFDLYNEAPRIDVPVFFFLGRHDIIVSSALAEEYFHKLEAPAGKTLIWFEKSAHRPFYEEIDHFLYIMNDLIPSEVLTKQ